MERSKEESHDAYVEEEEPDQPARQELKRNSKCKVAMVSPVKKPAAEITRTTLIPKQATRAKNVSASKLVEKEAKPKGEPVTLTVNTASNPFTSISIDRNMVVSPLKSPQELLSRPSLDATSTTFWSSELQEDKFLDRKESQGEAKKSTRDSRITRLLDIKLSTHPEKFPNDVRT